MAASIESTSFRWLRNGDMAFAEMLAAIAAARHSVRLETYRFHSGSPGNQFLEALVRAQQRGVRTYVIADAWGSQELADSYWEPLRTAGGEFRWFNERNHRGFVFRDHRKLLVCDERVAFVGGFNLAPEYAGDGVTHGWCDVGLQLEGPLASLLAESFDKMFTRAELRHGAFMRVMRTGAHARIAHADGELLMSGPGRGFSTLKRALRMDLKHARRVQVMAAYFLPTWKLRRELQTVARRGGQVQLMFATAATVAPHMKSGRLKALAVTSAQPSALLPGMPTVAASGLPSYESVASFGVLAPAKTPAASSDSSRSTAST